LSRLNKDLLLRIIDEAQQEYMCEEKAAEELIMSLLRSALALTGSEHGCMYLVTQLPGQTEHVKNIASIIHTNAVCMQVTAESYDVSLIITSSIDAFARQVLSTHKSIIQNNLSFQHPVLESCLVLPVVVKNKLLGIIGMASQRSSYSQKVISFLAPFLSTCALVMQKVNILSGKQSLNSSQLKSVTTSAYTIGNSNKGVEELAMLYTNTSKPVYSPDDAEKKLLYVLNQSLDEVIQGIICSAEDIRQDSKILEALTQQKEHLKLSIWAAELGLWDWEIKSGKVIYNQRWAEMLGYELDEIEPHFNSWEQLVHPEDMPLVIQEITNHLNGKTSFYQAEHRLRSKSGEWKWVLVSGKIFSRNDSGEPIRFAGTHLDITERKRTEEENKKLAMVAQKTNNAVIITDARGITEWVNEGFTRISGYSIEEIIGKKPGALLQGAQTDSDTIRTMREAIDAKKGFNVEIVNYSKQGKPYWMQLDVQSILDDKGSVQQFIAIQTDITALKQAEQLLSFQSNILYHVKDSVIVTDLSGVVTYYNKGAEEIFGYTAEEMIGNTLHNIYPELPDPQVRTQTIDRILQGNDFDGEWLGKHKSGELVWVHVVTTLMRDTRGVVTGMIGVAKDITDRKKTEQKLTESEAYLRSILDATVQTYFLIDSSYQIIKFNQSAANAVKFTYHKELQIADSMLEYCDADAINDFKKNIQKAFSGEKVFVTREIKHAHSNAWYEIQYLPAYNEQNQIYAAAFISLDISNRKQTELALLKSYQEVETFKTVLNASALISITDATGTITEVNDAFCDISKYSRQELIGKKHNVINSGYHSPEFFSGMWKTITKGQSWRDEIKNKAKDGSYYWVDTIINPVFDETGKIKQYISVVYLITQRKKAEEDREKLITDLTKFAFITAHNLRGPLARILGLISIFNPSDPMDCINATVIEKLKISANELDEVIHKMIHSMNIRENGKDIF
jgi:PAS domain S-box-containing protein